MTLSYDFAFLVMLRLSLADTTVSFSQRRCFAHPLKKRNVMDRNGELDYCARAAAILGYHKIRDDLCDERGAKKLRARLVYPFVAHSRKKALRAGLSELDGAVADGLLRLSELEKKRVPSVDAPASIFGEVLAAICSFGFEGTERRIASELGRCVGKWIYIVDALDDMTEDVKRGRYNPFLCLYGGRMPEQKELDGIKDALRAELLGAEAACDLIETEKTAVKNIIENTLFLGMPETASRIADGDGVRDGKNKRRNKRKGEV